MKYQILIHSWHMRRANVEPMELATVSTLEEAERKLKRLKSAGYDQDESSKGEAYIRQIDTDGVSRFWALDPFSLSCEGIWDSDYWDWYSGDEMHERCMEV